MTIQVLFFNDGDLTNDGKIRLNMIDNGAGPVGDFNIYWGVTGPLGQVLKAYDAGTPDDNIANGQTSAIIVDIPLDTNGKYQAGTYTFQWKYEDTGAPGADPTEGTYSFEYAPVVAPGSPVSGEATMTATFNCLNAKITVQDSTNVVDYITVSREISVLPPQVAGQPAPVAETSTNDLFETTFLWNNAPYQVGLTVLRTLVEDVTQMQFYVREKLVANKTLDIVCNTDLCDAATCLATEVTALESLSCGVGGWANLTAIQKSKAERALYYTVIALAYRQCGNFNKAAEWAAKADTCDCGCSGTAVDGGIEPYTPPIG